jgi:metal-responsive CopG/Arc/MetJ family transcriptional regulator
MKRILLSLPDETKKIIDNLKGVFGESDSEVVRSIVIAFLSEKGYLSKKAKP